MKMIKRCEVATKCNTTWAIQRSALDYFGHSHGVVGVFDASSPTLAPLGFTDDLVRYGKTSFGGVACEIVLLEDSAYAMLVMVEKR